MTKTDTINSACSSLSVHLCLYEVQNTLAFTVFVTLDNTVIQIFPLCVPKISTSFMSYIIIIIIYFSFRGSVQDYKIHMDMEIVMFA